MRVSQPRGCVKLRLKYTKLTRRAGALFLRIECHHSHLVENNAVRCIGTLWETKVNTVLVCRCLFCCISKPSLLFFPFAQFHYLLTFLFSKPPPSFFFLFYCYYVLSFHSHFQTLAHVFLSLSLLSIWACCAVLPQKEIKMEEDTNSCFLRVVVSLFLTIVNLSFRKT